MTKHEPWTEVREERVARGLSITELADLACISRAHMYGLESGTRTPSTYALLKIARALGVRPARIKRLSEPMTCRKAEH